jgi:tRNA(Ile)-lysidine synthase
VGRGRSVCAAYSGGLDSTVLLDLLARHREGLGYSLTALHVHHGLSANADDWARACERFAASLDVPIRVERVRIAAGDPAGTEAAARAARHEAFSRAGTDFVALAHHRDDQAETVLLQALRGTGTKGLAAMGEARALGGITLLRPLLDVPRAALADYACEHSLAWVDDESNALTAFDRNFLRHEILPLIARRFPQYRESFARLARHAAAATAVVEELAREDASRIADGDGLSAEGLGKLGALRGANALRHFLAAHGLAMPGEARLAELLRQLVAARDDARVLLPYGARSLVRHRGRILVEDAANAVPAWEVAWRGERVLPLGEGRGEVRFGEAVGEGIATARIASGRWHFAPRAGGERIRLRPGGHARTLKNLLQEHDIPVWQRHRLPLLFEGGRLVWVPGIGVAADYRPEAGSAGLLPDWHP